MRYYTLSDFTEEEISKAKLYMKKALVGFVTVKAPEQIDVMFEKFRKFSFSGQDRLHFTLELETLGNDFLAALGAARVELADNED